MKVSKQWLQKFFDAPLPSTEALIDGIMFHAFEVEGVEKVDDDEVLDLKVLQRGHDCLSHRGIAKEISAIFKIPIAHDPFANASDISKKTDQVAMSIDTPLCKRYIAGYIKGVKVGPSPKWLQERLAAVGQRSINNVVDATNFVMFNTGQPLHAFDAGKLAQKNGKYAIAVRGARSGEKMLALDGKEYTLNESNLVIADKNKDEAIGIAGVKGGMPSAITEDTKDIIIESANFDGGSVRKTAQALKLRTDASTRFEQGLSPELAARGMEGMLEFVAHLFGGEVAGFVDVYPNPQTQTSLSITTTKVRRLLGVGFGEAEIKDTFTRLVFDFKQEGETFTVVVPFERLDLEIPEDLVEEVGRIVGYDQVPATPLPPAKVAPEVNKNFYWSEHVREQLAEQGYSEVFTSVFAEKGERIVANKVDGVRPYLRTTLVPGLQEALKKNIPNKDLLGLTEIKLFEIGTAWQGGKEFLMVGTASEKGGVSEKPLAEYMSGSAPTSYENLPLSTAARYQPFSKYPYIVRDVSLWLPVGNSTEYYRQIIKQIFDSAGDILAEISLQDVKYYEKDYFEKGDKKSVSYRLIFQSFERTLTEVEVNAIMEKISAKLQAQGFEIR